jgi:hypothetical protein
VKPVPGKKYWYTVANGAPYMYWNDTRNTDTLYMVHNRDTITAYELAFMTPRSGSNFELPSLRHHPVRAVAQALYFALFHPFFINAESALQMLASFENLILLMALAMVLYGMVRRKKSRLLPVALMTFALSVSIIVSLSSPNSGAVFRYRAPAVVFILLSALYYYEKPSVRSRGETRLNT